MRVPVPYLCVCVVIQAMMAWVHGWERAVNFTGVTKHMIYFQARRATFRRWWENPLRPFQFQRLEKCRRRLVRNTACDHRHGEDKRARLFLPSPPPPLPSPSPFAPLPHRLNRVPRQPPFELIKITLKKIVTESIIAVTGKAVVWSNAKKLNKRQKG